MNGELEVFFRNLTRKKQKQITPKLLNSIIGKQLKIKEKEQIYQKRKKVVQNFWITSNKVKEDLISDLFKE